MTSPDPDFEDLFKLHAAGAGVIPRDAAQEHSRDPSTDLEQ